MNTDALLHLQRTFEDMAQSCGINRGMLAYRTNVQSTHVTYLNTFVHFAWLGYVASVDIVNVKQQRFGQIANCNNGNNCPWTEGYDRESHCRACGLQGQGSGQ